MIIYIHNLIINTTTHVALMRVNLITERRRLQVHFYLNGQVQACAVFVFFKEGFYGNRKY